MTTLYLAGGLVALVLALIGLAVWQARRAGAQGQDVAEQRKVADAARLRAKVEGADRRLSDDDLRRLLDDG